MRTEGIAVFALLLSFYQLLASPMFQITRNAPTLEARSSPVVYLTSGGITRSYRLYVPSTYNKSKATPLILAYHGRGENAIACEDDTQFSDPSNNPNAIVAYPNGQEGDDGEKQWQGDPDSVGVNDIQFTFDIITKISGSYNVDPLRIYAAGKSNGGAFVNILACNPQASQKIAAFGTVAAANYLVPSTNFQPRSCTPSRTPIAIIDFHGYEDETIPYNGGTRRNGNRTEPLPQWFGDWAIKNGCSPVGGSTTSLCSGSVIRHDWTCHAQVNVFQHYNISNVDHIWPTDSDTCFSTTKLIMNFFNTHHL